jgi:hypothetical protein
VEYKFIDSNCSPSDSIDQFWKVHIFYTKNYNCFCIENFGKFIHHNPDVSLDQESKQEQITRTIKLYMRNIYISLSLGYKFIYSKTSHFKTAIKIYVSNDCFTCKYKTDLFNTCA